MKSNHSILFFIGLFIASMFLIACGERDDDDTTEGPLGGENSFVELLTNQVNEVILSSMNEYQEKSNYMINAVARLQSDINEETVNGMIGAYQDAYVAYQAAAVHNYFATTDQDLVNISNLYPVDIDVLNDLIENRSYFFEDSANQRANGFPVFDYIFFGTENPIEFLKADPKRIDFVVSLTSFMIQKAESLRANWAGILRNNFINNGGTALGSSVSVQLNEHLLYYEEHIRENKVGIPIGRLGPNDDPIPADGNKIEAYHQSVADGNDDFSLRLLRAAIEEVEDLYLGSREDGTDGMGYDDLVSDMYDMPSIDQDIKAQFTSIYNIIDTRDRITGNDDLYNAIQGLITLYKTDLLPVLNVQDADGANDGD